MVEWVAGRSGCGEMRSGEPSPLDVVLPFGLKMSTVEELKATKERGVLALLQVGRHGSGLVDLVRRYIQKVRMERASRVAIGQDPIVRIACCIDGYRQPKHRPVKSLKP